MASALEFGNQSKSYLSLLVRNALNGFKAFSYQALTVDATVKQLTIPDGAVYALMTLESDASGIAARYLETLQTPVSTTAGMALSNLDRFDVTDAQNLSQFQITRAQAGTHTLHVQYYK